MRKITLGEFLKQRREAAGLTLRQIEEGAGVSNPYLSQLENGKIKRPSVNILYKVCSFLGIDFDEVLFYAGLIDEHPAFSDTQNITAEEQQQLLEYLEFLRSKKNTIKP
ncbi:helix-turn-helix domain-containing protein [Flavihumibacter petaseus]|uniref:Putative Xre family transcriptional regulator n=1 Tax=Flavihumibacter petaseus NBRC 106054 TaxID=1220578 RepID=A0A0E9N338_9BACT|nr:helix-turn-helix transcriptional regulator [Flavihumibacter petaseus]GAO43775.1 putative Xre family transcriptional regulator [Flavihumibacter petaseus NBRC 106054]